MILSKEIKSEIKETLSSSSIHSFPNIVQNKYNSIRLVWVVCLILSTAACCFFIVSSIIEYFSYDVVSKTNINYLNKIDFPIISICDLNAFNTKYANDVITQAMNQAFNFSNFNYSFSATLNKYNLIAFKYFAYMIAKNLNETSRKNLGTSLDQRIFTCLFNVVECNLTNDFEYYYDFLYGNCFRYNSGTNMNGERSQVKQISTTGILNGLQLELFVDAINNNDNIFSIDHGLNLFIENKKIESFSSEGIRISPGSMTHISLSKYSISHLPSPYSSCTANLDRIESSNNIYFRKILQLNKSYEEPICRFNCFQKYLGDKCQCQDPNSIPFYDNMKYCLNVKDFNCQVQTFTNFSNLGLFEDCECPIRCSSDYYTYTVSYSQYPTKYYAKFLSKDSNLRSKYNFSTTFDYDEYRSKIAAVNIFFDELKESVIEHNPKLSEVELISNIGGTLGMEEFFHFD